MTEHKFTDEEVINSLKICANNGDCKECAINPHKGNYGYCTSLAINAALDLINRQREEIERMKAGKVYSIGDKLYIILEDETAPGGWGIEINNVTEVGERFIFFSGFYPPRDDVLGKVPIEDIGKDVFLDEEVFRRELERRRLKNDQGRGEGGV